MFIFELYRTNPVNLPIEFNAIFNRRVTEDFDFVYEYEVTIVDHKTFNWDKSRESILTLMLWELREKDNNETARYNYGEVSIETEYGGQNNLGVDMTRYIVKIPIKRLS